MHLREMDERIDYRRQLTETVGPVVLINQFSVAPENVEQFLTVWASDAEFMQRQAGFISTQLHRGTAGSTTFVNIAHWHSAQALGEAFLSPEFQRGIAAYPDSVTATPHLFTPVAVPGIRGA